MKNKKIKKEEKQPSLTNGNSGMGAIAFQPNNGNSSLYIGTTTSTATMHMFPEKTVIDTKFIKNEEGNFIEITYKIKYKYNFWVGTIPPVQEGCEKEIYGVKDGRIQLIKTIKGTYVAEHTVPESFDWEE